MAVGSSESPVTPATEGILRAWSWTGKVIYRVGELGEDQNLFLGMALQQQIDQRGELRVAARVPGAGEFQHLHEGLGVGTQILRQCVLEQTGAKPFESPAELCWRAARRFPPLAI